MRTVRQNWYYRRVWSKIRSLVARCKCPTRSFTLSWCKIGVESGPANRIAVKLGMGNVHTAISLGSGDPGVDISSDLPTVRLPTYSPRTSNTPLCVNSGGLHVGAVSVFGKATVDARSDYDSLLVGRVPFLSNMVELSNDPSSGRFHFKVAPGDVARGSIEGDDQASAPGFRDRTSTGAHHSSVKPPHE